MLNVKFPPNPEDGTIFEIVPGVFHRFNAGSNCWVRLKGVGSLGLATTLTDGLMSKDDFRKLQDLIIPPPQATIRGEECDTTFRAGIIDLYSNDDSLNISKNLKLVKKTPTGNETESKAWSLHQNTAGFDFGVPLNRLVEEIESRNQLKKVQLQGDKGPKGKRGEPGEDRLDTGPVGQNGAAGLNSPFAGTLATEPIPFELVGGPSNRAIVDVTVEADSETEYSLVATRANIGNPDACPSLITPQDFNSALIVALNTVAGKLVKNQRVTSGDCSLICRICASSIHHLNIEPLLTDIFNRFSERVQNLKMEKEELVKAWLGVMVALFNEQKAALCCALENCRSRKRNERTRQYIETQRIQAAQSDFSLLIDGRENKLTTDMDAFKDCPAGPQEPNAIIPFENGVIFSVDAKIHISDPRAGNPLASLSAYLPAGSYVAEITQCCANFNDSQIGNAFSGRSAVLYKARTAIDLGTIGEQSVIESSVAVFPDFGEFETESAAKNAYQGLTLSFEHAGGDVAVWLVDPDGFVANNDGRVIITITDASALSATSFPSASGFAYVYRDRIGFDTLLGRIVPFAGGLTANENFGNIPGEVDLTVGPELVKDQAKIFLYDGSDGLSIFFVAGEQAGSFNEQEADLVIDAEITDNTVANQIRAADTDANVRQLSSTLFSANMPIQGDSTGFAIGEIDPAANYSIKISPRDLSTMRLFIASDADLNDIQLAEGGSEGIGGTIATVTQQQTATLFDIEDVPEGFGGSNERGIELRNEADGQSVTITRPIDLDIPVTVEDTGIPFVSPIPLPEPQPVTTSEDDLIVGLDDPIPTIIPQSIIDEKGGFIGEAASSLPRGTPGSPQDPCVLDVRLSIASNTLQSLRYVMTDGDGVKYYSAFMTTEVSRIGEFHLIEMGPAVAVIAPPPEFTPAIIRSKNLDVSLIEDQLTDKQRRVAESLEGIARLTYVQALIGSSVNRVANGRAMTDIEIEFQAMPVSQVKFGFISTKVGLPGATTEIIIDDFKLVEVPVAQDEPEILGRVKRIVASQSGSDSSTNGLIYAGLANYFGDYVGLDRSFRREIDFHGNNFFLMNEAGDRVTQATSARGFKVLNTSDNATAIASESGMVTGDAIAVDEFGVVYIADGRAGKILAVIACNALILNTTYGDANDRSCNVVITLAQNLPKTDDVTITLGRKIMDGENMISEVVARFGSTWVVVDGVGAAFLKKNPAARDDTTTIRCCFGGNPPGQARMVSLFTDPKQASTSGTAFGNSITTNRNPNPQPSTPVPGPLLDENLVRAFQQELDQQFNQFEFFVLEDDKVYEVNPKNGNRVLFRELGENAFGLRGNPRTKDLYFITDDRGTTPRSGTRIKRIDVDDFNDDNQPKIKTVYVADEDEGIFGITFGVSVPTDPTTQNQVLYALLSTFEQKDVGRSVAVRLVEISEQPVPPPPNVSSQLSPTNSDWVSTISGGRIEGNPNTILISRVPPGGGCQMHYKQVQWYERGWRIGACCGALVEFGGVHYIVAKRSLGADLSCGGGESSRTPCIAQYLDANLGHPAIAWPTVPPTPFDPPGGGGEEFLGLPTSGFVNFVQDTTLSDSLLAIIQGGGAATIKGNPSSEIPFILFPAT